MKPLRSARSLSTGRQGTDADMEQERILVVDDDEGLLHLLKMRLTAMGFLVTACTDGEAALTAARRQVFDLAVIDLRLKGRDGLELTEELLLIHPSLPVLIATAHGTIPNAVEAIQRGAFGYLTKPFDEKEFQAHIEKALAQQRMTREIKRLKMLVKELYGMENVIGRSQKMQVLFQQIVQVADTDATICLSGETGTGKEVVARVIYCNSRRARGPFIAVTVGPSPKRFLRANCSGMFGVPSPDPTARGGGCFRAPMVEPCFSTRSVRCPSRCKSNSCGPFKNGKSRSWEPMSRRK